MWILLHLIEELLRARLILFTAISLQLVSVQLTLYAYAINASTDEQIDVEP